MLLVATVRSRVLGHASYVGEEIDVEIVGELTAGSATDATPPRRRIDAKAPRTA